MMKRFATCCAIGLVLTTGVLAHEEDDDFDVSAGRVDAQVDLKHDREMPRFTPKGEPIPSNFIRLSNAVSQVPFSEHCRARERVLKLGKFYADSLEYLRDEMKVKPPVDLILLVLFFALCSYIPSLLLTVVVSMCKGKKQPTFSPE